MYVEEDFMKTYSNTFYEMLIFIQSNLEDSNVNSLFETIRRLDQTSID